MKKHLNLKLPISRKSLHRKKEQNENGESERNENQMDFQCYYLMLECGEFFVSWEILFSCVVKALGDVCLWEMNMCCERGLVYIWGSWKWFEIKFQLFIFSFPDWRSKELDKMCRTFFCGWLNGAHTVLSFASKPIFIFVKLIESFKHLRAFRWNNW